MISSKIIMVLLPMPSTKPRSYTEQYLASGDVLIENPLPQLSAIVGVELSFPDLFKFGQDNTQSI